MSQHQKKYPRWWPGMYERKTPGQTNAEIGASSTSQVPPGTKTPDAFFWQKLSGKLDRNVLARY